eukprot:NODE_91_length_21779_cov_0.171356.p11 type:complete len:191 gc:universal NODE_91_length_21779_cov_0.171356:13050-13622(+)
MLLILLLYCSFAAKEIQKLTDSTFDAVKTGEWVVIFEAKWCPYCQNFKKTIQELSNKLKGYEIGTVDIDTESALNSRFLIQKLPSVFILSKGVAKEINPNFNVDKLMDAIKDSKDKSPIFVQPFGVMGYGLFYLGWFGKQLMVFVTLLRSYFPDWLLISFALLLFGISLYTLVIADRKRQSVVGEKKKKQ